MRALALVASALIATPAAADWQRVVPPCTSSPARESAELPLCGSPADLAATRARARPAETIVETVCPPGARRGCWSYTVRSYQGGRK